MTDYRYANKRHLRVFLASPGDVHTERVLVRSIIDELNQAICRLLEVHLELFSWDVDVFPAFHPEGGQAHIDRLAKIEDCALLIGIFWARFGTKIPSGETGTEHEIRRALEALKAKGRPQIMLYFSDQPIPPSHIDPEQLSGVGRFRAFASSNGVYSLYKDHRDFETKLRRDIQNWLTDEFSAPTPDSEPQDVYSETAAALQIHAPDLSGVFFGRSREILSIAHQLLAKSTTVVNARVALRGMAGVGKSQVAAAFASEYSDRFEKILWIKAETPDEFDRELASLAPSLIPAFLSRENVAEDAKSARRWLETHSGWLLIVDNVDEIDTWRKTLPSNPEGRVLLTTLNPVPTDFARTVPINPFPDDIGGQLLLRRANIIDEETPLDSIDPRLLEKAREISSRLGGLALAIDQAGGYMQDGQLSPADYLRDYNEEEQRIHEDYPGNVHSSVLVTFRQTIAKLQANSDIGVAVVDLVVLCALVFPLPLPESFVLRPLSVPSEDWQRSMQPLGHLGPFTNSASAWRRVVRLARSVALIERDEKDLQYSVHRLTADAARIEFSSERAAEYTEMLIRMVASSRPLWEDDDPALFRKIQPYALWSVQQSIFNDLPLDIQSRLLHMAGTYYYRLADYKSARGFYERALLKTEEFYGLDSYEMERRSHDLVVLLADEDRLDEAERLVRKMIQQHENSGREPGLGYADAIDDLAWILRLKDRAEESLQARLRAIEVTKTISSAPMGILAIRLNNLATTYSDLGRYSEAKRAIGEALRIHAQIPEYDPISHATTILSMGAVYVRMNQPRLGRKYALEALKRRKRLLGGLHPDVAHCYDWLGRAHYLLGHRKKALKYMNEALKIRIARFGDEHSLTIGTRDRISKIQRGDPIPVRFVKP